jgi:3',5'-cyclic AMP phosphodiesterase CpdA
MRIAVTSDLHYDVTPQNRKLVRHLVEEVARLAPDALVLPAT